MSEPWRYTPQASVQWMVVGYSLGFGPDGLFFGNAALFGAQAVAVLATWVYSAAVTYVLLKVLDRTLGLRVNAEQGDEGLDVAEHGESAYALD